MANNLTISLSCLTVTSRIKSGINDNHRVKDKGNRLYELRIHDWSCFQKWRNLLLTWDPEKYGGIKRVRINPSLIWIPDIVLYNR